MKRLVSALVDNLVLALAYGATRVVGVSELSEVAVTKLVLAALLLSPAVALADGWVDCNGPDKNGHCNASGADAGAGLVMLAGVGFVIGRKRRNR